MYAEEGRNRFPRAAVSKVKVDVSHRKHLLIYDLFLVAVN